MPDRIRDAGGSDGIDVVGTVPDLAPYYHAHRVLAVPIRTGSGTRLKLFEAFASGIPAVSTTVGAEGIAYQDGTHLLVADDPSAMADAIVRLLRDDSLATAISEAALALAEERYDWSLAAAANLAGIHALAGDRLLAPATSSVAVADDAVNISIVIPTLNGGALLDRTLRAIAEQEIDRSVEVICVDSASNDDDQAMMRAHGVNLVTIDRRDFNHGRTRDLGAGHARGTVVVFLNQDAVPADRSWLAKLTAPLFEAEPPAAVQGGIAEFPHGAEGIARFFWDSCGTRFYFTRESERWLARYDGLGFSTVNAAIRRAVWQAHPFGFAPIMEDKKWQREVAEAGHTIVSQHEAQVWHTHDYNLRSLTRRCRSEGVGWRFLGETYSASDMIKDQLTPHVYAELARGVLGGRCAQPGGAAVSGAATVAAVGGQSVEP